MLGSTTPSSSPNSRTGTLSTRTALIDNDVATLDGFFWDSPHACVSAWRRISTAPKRSGRSAKDVRQSTWSATFCDSTSWPWATLARNRNLEFMRTMDGIERHGRQTQFWFRFAEGWKIVSAHVSCCPAAVLPGGGLRGSGFRFPRPAAPRSGRSEPHRRDRPLPDGISPQPGNRSGAGVSAHDRRPSGRRDGVRDRHRRPVARDGQRVEVAQAALEENPANTDGELNCFTAVLAEQRAFRGRGSRPQDRLAVKIPGRWPEFLSRSRTFSISAAPHPRRFDRSRRCAAARAGCGRRFHRPA